MPVDVSRIRGHKDWTKRKRDPNYDMGWRRARVAKIADQEDDMPTLEEIRLASRGKVLTVSLDPSPIPGAVFVADFDALTLTHVTDTGDYGLFQRMLSDAGIEHRHYDAQAGDDFSGWKVILHSQPTVDVPVVLSDEQITDISRKVAEQILNQAIERANRP